MIDSGPYQVGSNVGDVVALCPTKEPNRTTEQMTDLDMRNAPKRQQVSHL